MFYSPIAAFQVICRPKTELVTPTGVVYDEIRELLAEFAIHGAEYSYTTADGFTERASDIRGHFFDLDAQAEQKGWDDDEKEIVARHLLRVICPTQPEFCQLHTEAPAGKPWPTYDSTHHNQIPTLAETLGLVAEALTYERQNKNRESVIVKLNELLSASASNSNAPDDEDLIAA